MCVHPTAAALPPRRALPVPNLKGADPLVKVTDRKAHSASRIGIRTGVCAEHDQFVLRGEVPGFAHWGQYRCGVPVGEYVGLPCGGACGTQAEAPQLLVHVVPSLGHLVVVHLKAQLRLRRLVALAYGAVVLPFQRAARQLTRIAALLSGEVDMVRDTSIQDLARIKANPQLKVMEMVENRTVYLALDQFRDELPGSNIKGKNPLKDVRVRKALYQAIDMDTIARVSLRGLGQPTGALVAPQVNGWTKDVHKRFPFDPSASQKLLAEAGYKDGFEVNFSCPNNRYINDEQICQAVTAMWAKVGIKAKLRTEPLTTYFPMIQRHEASIYMLGWGVPTFDAFYSLQSLVRTVGEGGDGNYNIGRYSSPQMDALIERTRKEIDLNLRTELLTKALAMQNEEVAHIPLHNQIIPWAMKKGVDVVHRADNRIDWRLLKVK